MPISLPQIAANTAKVTIQMVLTAEDGTTSTESVTVVYYPGRITERILVQLQGFTDIREETVVEDLEAFNVTMASLIKSWDVYQDAEQTVMFPIEATRLAELPLMFRLEILTAIMNDLRPEALAPQATLNSSH